MARTAAAGLAFASLPSIVSRAEESLPRKGPSRMKLSLAAYSFRNYFKDRAHKRDDKAPAGPDMDLFGFIDFCAAHHCDAAELTSYYFPANTDKAFLLKLKRHAFLRGVQISGSAVGNTFTNPAGPARDKEMETVKKWIGHCELLGAPHLRVFAGGLPKGISEKEGVANCIESLREACAEAAQHGVFLGVENHGGIVAEPAPLLEILKAVDSPWLGINLDSANFHTADPYADFAKCAPYAVNVQIKTETRPKDAAVQRADLKRYIQILRDANYQGYVALEFEENADPYKTVPGVLEELHKLIHVS
jgi:sugar phosphate isomerase/epimerase